MSDTPQKTALFNPLNGHLEQLFSYIDMGDLGLPTPQRKEIRSLSITLLIYFPKQAHALL